MLIKGFSKLINGERGNKCFLTDINKSIMDNVNAFKDEVKKHHIQAQKAANQCDDYLNDLLKQSKISGAV